MRVYLAGPMRGVPDCNFSAFAVAEQRWRDAGHSSISPARLSTALGLEPDRGDDLSTEEGRLHLRLAAQIDLAVLYAVDAIALLPRWRRSRGATMEVAVAQFLGLPTYDAETMLQVSVSLCPWDKFMEPVILPSHFPEGDWRQAYMEAAWSYVNSPIGPPRCPKSPGGEQCALLIGHEGACKWERGD
jgi:hypothetical protein